MLNDKYLESKQRRRQPKWDTPAHLAISPRFYIHPVFFMQSSIIALQTALGITISPIRQGDNPTSTRLHVLLRMSVAAEGSTIKLS
jgi:hypothetical protein